MKKLMTTLFCAAVLTMGASAVMACPPPDMGCHPKHHHGCMKKHHKPKFEEKLKLTDAQKTAARQNRLAAHEKMKPIMEQMRVKHEQMFKIMNSELSDAEKKKQIEQIKKEMKPLKVQANEIRKDNMKQFEALLTAEQKAELDKIKAEHKKFKKNKEFKHKPCPHKPCPDKKCQPTPCPHHK